MSATIALVAGDPAGVGPELVAKLLADPAALPARIRLIGHRASLDAAARLAGVALDLPPLRAEDAAHSNLAVARMEWKGWNAAPFAQGQANADNGAFMLDALMFALDMARSGVVDAVCFAPLNKSALRAGGMKQEDELRWFADVLGHRGPCGEFNVLEKLWTSRVTSHVSLKEVPGLLSAEGVAEAIGMLTPRCAGRATRRRASASAVSTRTMATTAATAARRSTSSLRASGSPRRAAMLPTDPIPPTRFSCARATARSMAS